MTAELVELVELVEALVTDAAGLRPGDLSDEVVGHAGLVFADSAGVIAAGARSTEVVALSTDPVTGLQDEPTAVAAARTLGPRSRWGEPTTVAWLNGTAGTFLELDEGFRPTGHPAIQVVPAALAVAEATRASGLELATAIVAGYEVAARLFESFALPAPMHPHGHLGGLGAATAVAMLTDADPVALVRIAATQPLLTGWDACYLGAPARNTWTGHANRAGVLAGTLYRAGFTGTLASHLSVLAAYVRQGHSLAEPVTDETLRIRRNYFKFHSACALNHSALDAVLEARARLDGDVRDVSGIEVETVPANLRINRLPEPNSLSTRFSLPYAMAAALLTGSTGPEAFEWNAEIAAYAERVTVIADAALERDWPAAAPARVRVTTPHETVEVTVENPRGHHARPATRAQLRDKFVSLLTDERSPPPDALAERFDTLADLRAVRDCSGLPLPGSLAGKALPHS